MAQGKNLHYPPLVPCAMHLVPFIHLCGSSVLNRFTAVAAPDIVQGLSHRDLFLPVGGYCGEKRELGRGVRKIPKPDLHKPDPHPASAGLEEQFLEGPIEVEIPETQLGQVNPACDLLLIGIPDHQARLAGKQ
jgi:hypothetical protein